MLQPTKQFKGNQRGYALITVLVLLALLMAMLLTHFGLTWVEMSTTKSSMNSFIGFYAAEAGLNVRADDVRSTFQGYNRPSGTSPDTSGATPPCSGTNLGNGDFACINYAFQDRDVATYLLEAADSGNPIVVPRGETFQNLNGHEYHFVVHSRAISTAGSPEAVLEVHVKNRQMPLFQFAAFYDKDLEILPAGLMTLSGPVHSNGDLYVGTGATLDITGQVTTAGRIYRGRKDSDTCLAGPVRVSDPENLTEIPTCSSARAQIVASSVETWDGMVEPGVTILTVPAPETLEPAPGRPYWDSADIRIVLDLTGGTAATKVVEADGTVSVAKSVLLNACGAVGHSDSLYDNREATDIDMLDVDVQGLLNCLHVTNLMGVPLDDATDGGLVWYLGVIGPTAAAVNNYGVRLSKGAEFVSTVGGAPLVAGLTIATDQAIYIQGDYNSVNKRPAAVLADSLNILSNAWDDDDSDEGLDERIAGTTTINAAFLAGTDTTAGVEGAAGQDSGGYNGGLEAFMRFHEDWSAATLVYRGSFVSLNVPRHVDGAWTSGAPYYLPPIRDWDFDTDFEDATLLPPLSPQFVYSRQELFVRQFEL